MRRLRKIMLAGCFLMLGTIGLTQDDPYLWLEEILGEKALGWVKAQNEVTTRELKAVPGFQAAYDCTLKVLDAKDRIPSPERRGKYLYNFWKDAEHPRGVFRRTSLAEYRKTAPAWEMVLDIDALAKQENENWIYAGASFLHPTYDRCLVYLSRGGGDATVTREFDLVGKTFVKGGFQVPEAKSSLAWIDRDTVFVGTDFGPGSLTTSGYPRIVKIWKRGVPLAEARTILEVKPESMAAGGYRLFSRSGNLDLVVDSTDMYHGVKYLLKEGKLTQLNIPADADVAGLFHGRLLVSLRSDWDTGKAKFTQGSVIAGRLSDIEAGRTDFQLLAEPGPRRSIESVDLTRDKVIVTYLDNVVNKIVAYAPDKEGKWVATPVPAEGLGKLSVFGAEETDNDYFLSYQDFLTPASLWRFDGRTGRRELLKTLPARFDARPYQVQQFEAVSKDGTAIPYFIVMRKDAALDGQNPTLQYAYGGFEVSETPFYLNAKGTTWLEKGGVYVLANLRGGGEFGPAWHQGAILKNRHKVYEDMIAVSEDLIKRKITSPARLAIEGGSNGGLLVAQVALMRPDLYRAVVSEVPLTDMKRYSKLLAGASWMAEYGDPDDPDMWSYMKDFSPYHLVRREMKLPRMLFTTCTRDDRVHPAHARKMVARMKELGYDCLYWENTEGGHAGAANNEQRALMGALTTAYLYEMLGMTSR